MWPADPVVDFTRQINNLAKAYVREKDSTKRDAIRQHYLQLRAQGLESLAGELDARVCAKLLWTSAKFGQPLSGGEEQAWRAAVERTLQSAKPQEIANTLWALAKLGMPAEDSVPSQLLDQLLEVLGDAAPQAIANTLWALAKLGMPADGCLLPRLLDRLLEVLRDAGPQDIANTLWACATLGYRTPDREVSELLDQLLARLGDAKPQEIANTLWALAKLGMPVEDSVPSQLQDQLLEVLGDAAPQNIANTLWACATLGYRPPDRALSELLDGLLEVQGDAKPQEIANTLEDKLWCAKPQHISMALWACGELDFKPEHDVMVALLARFAAWLEAGNAARPVPTPQELRNVLGGCAELQQHAASAQPKRRPRWRCDPGFLDLCTAWAQQRFEQFTALDATDLLYSLRWKKILTTSSSAQDTWVTNLVWAATRCLERTQQEAYCLPPVELGRLVQLCVAQWHAEQAVPIPGALRLLDSLPGQGLALQAADPATAASLAWLADWVFEQVAALSEGCAQEGFGVDATAGLLNALAALGWQPSSQQAAAVVALCQWLARRSPGTPELNAGRRACLLHVAKAWRLDVATKALRSLPEA
eukprot:scaffold11.g3847.t1